MNNQVTPVHPQTKKRGKGRWVLLALVVLGVLIAVALLRFPKELNPDRLIRTFRYMGLRDKETYGRVLFDAGASNSFAGFDDGLLVAGEGGLTLFNLEGEQKAFIQGSIPEPVLTWSKEVALCFSPGSSYVAAVGDGGAVLLDQAFSGAFVDADVSPDGCAAYITTESGYKSVATVINQNQDPIYRFSSRTRYLNACAVSEKGELLAVAALEEENSIYRSGLSILRTDEPLTDLEGEDSSAARADLGNQVIYDLFFLDRNHLAAVGQNSLIFLDRDGKVLSELSLLDQHLTDYAVSDEGWMILALNPGGGADYRVLVLSAQGETLGDLTLTDRVRSVSAAGRYAAVLTDQYAQTYDRHLTEFDRCWDILAATRVIARPDGTLLLVGSGSAKLYIP